MQIKRSSNTILKLIKSNLSLEKILLWSIFQFDMLQFICIYINFAWTLDLRVLRIR